jgi:3'-phosphoadenosine 5'-phosphosulfate sulfotransferase (PAPS reductase)/FAD synthetase
VYHCNTSTWDKKAKVKYKKADNHNTPGTNMKTMNQKMIDKIKDLRDRGAVFFINHSGGKDSQTQTLEISRLVPVDQIVIVHADLVEQDWQGSFDHLLTTAPKGVKITKCRSRRTFFEMVRERGMWPSPKYRQWTSDLKRTPIEKVIRHELKARGSLLAANCMGIRAEESYTRAKQKPIRMNNRLSKAGREVWDLLPIFYFTTQEVFERIAAGGQRPHWIYKHLGRLSCIICIFGTPKDIRTSASLRPDIFKECVSIEKEIGHTVKIGKTLEEFAGLNTGGCKACDHFKDAA